MRLAASPIEQILGADPFLTARRPSPWRMTADGHVLAVAVPGVPPEALDLRVEDDVLTLTIDRRTQPERQDGAWRSLAASRTAWRIDLPEGADAAAVTASAEHGLLTIVAPRPAAALPRRIAIAAGPPPAAIEAVAPAVAAPADPEPATAGAR